ncbi:hypothetical protein Hanom_Chr11g00992141 [Helianthus anomalus]
MIHLDRNGKQKSNSELTVVNCSLLAPNWSKNSKINNKHNVTCPTYFKKRGDTVASFECQFSSGNLSKIISIMINTLNLSVNAG